MPVLFCFCMIYCQMVLHLCQKCKMFFVQIDSLEIINYNND